MDDGRWTMDDGRWTMDDGRWTGDGRRATGDGRRATGDGRRATGDDGMLHSSSATRYESWSVPSTAGCSANGDSLAIAVLEKGDEKLARETEQIAKLGRRIFAAGLHPQTQA